MGMRQLKKILIIAFRILVGLLFIFSGLIKANDPLGLSYKMDEYFHVLHLTFLVPAALTFAIVMIAFEIIAGVALLLGFKMRVFGPLLLILIIFFTFLTGFSYLSGAITECGCFGDCIPMTAGMSFTKDLILLVLIFFLYKQRRVIKPFLGGFFTWLLMIAVVVFSFGFQRYVLRHLPIVDCLPYKIGNNIPQLMKVPPGATPDQYEMVFTYEKDGEEKEFKEDEIPWEDTAWHFVSREDKLIKKGNAQPVIADFSISDYAGNSFTQQILNKEGYTFLFFVKKTSEAKDGWQKKIQHLQADCERFDIPIYGITSSIQKQVDPFKQKNKLTFPFLQMDGVVIKTAARSNPCLILIKEGVIKGKWSYMDLPSGAVPSPKDGRLILKY